jgi:cobalt-precorrin 5A hydrolase/precorrin-3B C17-methyltransferase
LSRVTTTADATAPGTLTVVGLGPGGPDLRVPAATRCLGAATDIVGYAFYVEQAGPFRDDQTVHRSDNRHEAERAQFALDLAAQGAHVAVVSSGDPGVFAMATAVLEELHRALDRWAHVDVRIIPGVTAATAAAALVGAPLGHDFCVISLSDVLKPWATVVNRLDAASGADFVLALYNPISSHRPWQLGEALATIGRHRRPDTPVALVRDAGRPDEVARITTLGAIDVSIVDMRTVILVGSSTTAAFTMATGRTWLYTPRHYP